MKGTALPSSRAAQRRIREKFPGLQCALTCLALCLSFAVIGAASAVTAMPFDAVRDSTAGADGRQFLFDIPQQSLASALDAFANQSKMQVLYKTNAVQSHFSLGATGSFTVREALQHILHGTGLAAIVDVHNIAIISVGNERLSVANASLTSPMSTLTLPPLHVEASPSDGIFFDAYAHLVQAKIHSALGSNAPEGLRGRGLRLLVWVDAQGVIQQSAIVNPSGNSRIDQEVLDSVRGLPIQEEPPAGFPQPLHIHIHPIR